MHPLYVCSAFGSFYTFQFAGNHGIELIDLQVRSDNAAAIHLYKKYGFKFIGKSPAYMKIDGRYVDCDFMVFDLR